MEYRDSENRTNNHNFLSIALRHWSAKWLQTRVVLSIRSDNIAALSMLCKVSARSKALGIFARELALDISHACYSPEVVEHITGVSNVTADMLSRKFDPHYTFVVPPALCHLEPDVVEVRDPTWWKSVIAAPA